MVAVFPFSCTQARLQARFSRLPDAGTWRHLVATRSLSAYLEEARGGPLRPWVAPFSRHSDAHDLERGIRAQFLLQIGETAHLAPAAWRPAIEWARWWAVLPLLPAIHGGSTPDWAREDRLLAGLLPAGGGIDGPAMRAVGAGRLYAALTAGEPLHQAWLLHWKGLWPDGGGGAVDTLLRLEALMEAHIRLFHELPPDQTWVAREALRRQLCNRFHRWLQEPANLFVFLLLVALDLERLRGDLVIRALYPGAHAG